MKGVKFKTGIKAFIYSVIFGIPLYLMLQYLDQLLSQLFLQTNNVLGEIFFFTILILFSFVYLLIVFLTIDMIETKE